MPLDSVGTDFADAAPSLDGLWTGDGRKISSPVKKMPDGMAIMDWSAAELQTHESLGIDSNYWDPSSEAD